MMMLFTVFQCIEHDALERREKKDKTHQANEDVYNEWRMYFIHMLKWGNIHMPELLAIYLPKKKNTTTYSHYLALWAVEEKRMVFCGRYMLVFIASDEIPLIFSKYEFKTAMTAQRFIDSVHSARYSR